jgi:hypothetical protein
MKMTQMIEGNPMESSNQHWCEVAKAIDDATTVRFGKREAIPR